MNGKKTGLIAGGILAALVAVAPLASATEGPHGQVCTLTGGDAAAGSEIAGPSLSNIVTQNPTGGEVYDNDENCSNNDNNSDNNNGSGNSTLEQLLPF